MNRFLLCALLSLAATCLPAQTVRMLADIEKTPTSPQSSSPVGFTSVGPWAYFTADDGRHGREIFRTSGQPGSAQLVADVRPGRATSAPQHLTALGNTLLFAADDGIHGLEPWSTDGSASGTAPLGDFHTGAGSGLTSGFARFGGHALFATTDGTNEHLWVTDGRRANQLLALGQGPASEVDLEASAEVHDPTLGTLLFFVAREGARTWLWMTDGTVAGTRSIATPTPGWDRATVWMIATGGDHALANVRTSAGNTLWRVDATGLRLLTSLPAPIQWHAQFDSRVWFVAEPLTSRKTLFVTDGTVAGTQQFTLQNPFIDLLGVQSKALWIRNNSSLLRIDPGGGTPVNTGPYSVGPIYRIASVGSGFIIDTSRQLKFFDPRTRITLDLLNAPAPHLSTVAGKAVFQIDDARAGTELGFSDGTKPGTGLLADINQTGPGNHGSSPRQFVAWRQRALFTTQRFGTNDHDLWITDGQSVQNLLSGVPKMEGFVAVGDRVDFRFLGQGELWTTNGTAEGTRQVSTSADPLLYFHPAPATLGSEIFGIHRTNLLVSDGASVRKVIDLPARSWHLPFPTRLGNLIYFQIVESRNVSSHRLGLWTTDGTAARTFRLRSYEGLPSAGIPMRANATVATSDRVFYLETRKGNFELWSSQGTAGTTALVAPLGVRGTLSTDFVASPSHAFVSTSGTVWSSDGSGITPVLGRFAQLRPFRHGVLMDTQEQHLQFSDGTIAGTGPIQGDYDRTGFGGFPIMVDDNDHAVFVARRTTGSRELSWWITDGTTAGTAPFTGPDPVPSAESHRFAAFGSYILTSMADPAFGAEPHIIDLGASVQRTTEGCGGRHRNTTLDARLFGSPTGGLELRGRATRGSAAWIWMSVASRVPVQWPANGPCWLDLDAATVTPVISLPIQNSEFRTTVALPDEPALYGLQASMQAFVGPTDAIMGVDLTNGLLLTLGR